MTLLRRSLLIVAGVGVLSFAVFAYLFADRVVAARSLQQYERQPAPEFLFEQRPFHFSCSDRPSTLPPGEHSFVSSPNLAPFARTRAETLNLPLAAVPALTIVSEPSSFLEIAGSDEQAWSLQFCATGEGDSEQEARQFLDQISMRQTGSLIALSGAAGGRTGGHGDLLVQAPASAPLTLHLVGAVALRNLSGPVHLTAVGGRATLLNTTGPVDATAEVIDFAGARGAVRLTSASEIDLKLTGPGFLGNLSANAQREVRVRIPHGFQSPFEAWVANKNNFVCRADLCSAVKMEKSASGYLFRFAGGQNTASEHISLRSIQSTVVIDNWSADAIIRR